MPETTSGPVDHARRPASDLTRAEANRLTDRIRGALEKAWPLVLEAYERKAWAALGYASFKQYVETELGMSRGHAYRLIDQGSLILALEAVTGTNVDVSTTDAAALKSDVPETVAAISEAVKGKRAGRRKAAESTVRERAKTAIEAKATEKLTPPPRGADQQVQPQTSPRETRAARPAASIAERVEQVFKIDSVTAAEELVECRPVEVRDWPPGLFERLASWVEQAGKVGPAAVKREPRSQADLFASEGE